MASFPIRLTTTTRKVLDLFMEASAAGGAAERLWGYRICEDTGLGSGTVYPILERLLEADLVAATWEEPKPTDRPPRRFYSLTDSGAAAYAAALAARPRRRTTFTPRRDPA